MVTNTSASEGNVNSNSEMEVFYNDVVSTVANVNEFSKTDFVNALKGNQINKYFIERDSEIEDNIA